MVSQAHYAISAFGGIFLLLVSLKYFFDTEKHVHWIHQIEKHMIRWGHIQAIEIALALVSISVLSLCIDIDRRATILFSGLVGAILFIIIEGIASSFDAEAKDVAGSSIALFIYLNVLDSAFSLDGVVGALTFSSDLIVIGIGLGVGAFFVRSLMIFFVRERMLDTLQYLDHGAYWAILGLAGAMLVGF